MGTEGAQRAPPPSYPGAAATRPNMPWTEEQMLRMQHPSSVRPGTTSTNIKHNQSQTLFLLMSKLFVLKLSK